MELLPCSKAGLSRQVLYRLCCRQISPNSLVFRPDKPSKNGMQTHEKTTFLSYLFLLVVNLIPALFND
ncbi:hypothetical protein CSQ88_05490 [Iodobacter sp. BJB302]|nr:hypothetical protein CSQ88_05490 [Iodobacter sp. BJB302]